MGRLSAAGPPLDDAVTQALRACIAPVRCQTPQGLRYGSAFYVGPQQLLTCAHVVAGGMPVELRIAGQWQPADRVALALPEAADVALLRCAGRAAQFARLGRSAALRDPVRSIGFPVRKGAAHEEQITGAIEDLALQHVEEPWKTGARLFKFKDAQVWEGFSGAPLYDELTRRVVGIVSATRDKTAALGGIAVPAAVVLDADADLREAQRRIDWDATIWRDPPGAESAFLEHYLDPQSPFFGRDAALASLDAWLASASPRALLVAEAGRGKSSLIAHWYQRLRESEAAQQGRLQVALVPISIRFRHARESEVLESLGRRVAQWHPALRAGERRWREIVAEGLRTAAPAGAQCVLLLDGLDETVGWEADANLFPRRLGDGVRVLAAARRLAGRDAAQWGDRLGWSMDETTRIDLSCLSEADACDAAARWWRLGPGPAAALGRRLHALSRGEPLVLGMYLSSFGRDAAPAPQSFADLPPGLDGVFDRWWSEQAEQWQRDAAAAMGTIGRHLFNLLAAAFEPVSRRALLAVLRRLVECSGDELDAALSALARFIVGNPAGYALGHPELARWRWRKLQDDGDAQRYDEAYAGWLRALMADGDAAIDSYALHAGARHLQRSGRAALADWQRIAGDAWRAQHQRAGGWPEDYAADLALAAAAGRAADAADLAAGRPCRGLPLLAAVAFGRLSVERQTRRVPASLAAQALRCGLWTSAQALRQVLAAHEGDFPRIEALGAIAPWLAVPELERAMAALALERNPGFDWDETLGTWQLAAAAACSAAFDERTLADWAQSLPGIGQAQALLSLAAAYPGDAGLRWLERGLAALPAAAGHATVRTRLALGVRVGPAALHAAAGFDAWSLGARLGFDWDPTLQRHSTAAAALRVAWSALDRGERSRCASALADQVPRWIGMLQASVPHASPQDESWWVAHGDWHERLGAIWDVCSVELARRIQRPLRRHFARKASTGADPRTGFAAMLRFSSRLPPRERRFDGLAAKVERLSFAASTYWPEVRDLYDAAASLPEWQDAFAEQVHGLRARRPSEAVGVLRVVARHLRPEALERQWQAVGNFATDWREAARAALLGAMATHGELAVRRALQRADEADLGIEQRLLDAVTDGLQGRLDAPRRSAARQALAGLRDEHGLRAQLLSAIAAALSPWSLDEAEAWLPKGSGWRSLGMGWLLPHLQLQELCDAETPWRLAIDRVHPEVDASAEEAIRKVHAESGLAHALAWAAAMDEACGDARRGWTALAICALTGVAEPRDGLWRVALALPDPDARAEACAALYGGDADPQPWAAVESALREASAMGQARSVARILERLHGAALQRGIEAAAVRTRLLPRSGSDLTWSDRAHALMRWADAALIDRDFMPGGELARLQSSSDRNLLRAALAPRLLELGRIDDALSMAAAASDPQAWQAHVAMLGHLGDAAVARRFVEAVMRSTYSDLSLYAVARELQRGACRGRPAVLRELCDALLDAADSDARLRLHLAVLMPLLAVLCGSEGIDAVAASARGRPDAEAGTRP